MADLIGASPKEIVFTSGATESNNLAVKVRVHYYFLNTGWLSGGNILTGVVNSTRVLVCSIARVLVCSIARVVVCSIACVLGLCVQQHVCWCVQ